MQLNSSNNPTKLLFTIIPNREFSIELICFFAKKSTFKKSEYIKLKITKPSVNKAMKNLKEMELIKYQTYGNIELTKTAEEIAKKVLKKQDIIEIFLKEILEVDESQAIEEAKAMKYAISEETEQKLDNYISKILNLGDLECGYNSDNEKCRKCARITAKKKK